MRVRLCTLQNPRTKRVLYAGDIVYSFVVVITEDRGRVYWIILGKYTGYIDINEPNRVPLSDVEILGEVPESIVRRIGIEGRISVPSHHVFDFPESADFYVTLFGTHLLPTLG